MTDYSKMTDEQVNEAIAVKRGWKQHQRGIGWSILYEWESPTGIIYIPEELPDYTHDWRLAGELLEEMAMDGGGVSFMGKWHVDYKAGHNAYKMASAPAPQRAICEAWLAWKELENK